MLDAILVGYDGSESAVAALAFASRLAVRERAKLIVAYVITPAAGGVDGLPSTRVEAERWLETTAQPVAAEVVPSEVVPSEVEKLVIEADHVADALLDLSSDRAVALIAVGRTETRGLRQVLAGTIADRLLKHADCSLAICPPSSPNLDVSDVIVDLDDSEPANEALRQGAALADSLQAPLHILGVVPRPPPTSRGEAHEMNRASVWQHQRDYLAQARDSLTAQPPSVFVEVREGEVAQQLITFARPFSSALIVIGHRGLGGFLGLHLPSLGRELVRRARGPVLVARPQVVRLPAKESAEDVGDEQRQAITARPRFAARDAVVCDDVVAHSHPRPGRVERARPSAKKAKVFEERPCAATRRPGEIARKRSLVMRKLVLLLAVLALAAVGLAACGGDDDGDGNGNGAAATEEPSGTTGETESGGAGGSEVAISADPSGALAYEQQAVVGQGSSVTIDLTNDAAVAHDVRIEDADGNDLGGTEIFAEGAESVTLDLEPGEYTFFCSVPGHRQAGMEGTLTVK